MKTLLTLIAVALLALGCAETRLATGGAYSQSEVSKAQPELFALDASFDVAYAALDTVFKYEKQNRIALWRISPNIKRGLDKLRKESNIVATDYAIARTVYLTNQVEGLSGMQSSLNKLQAAGASAVVVIQNKGLK